MMRRAGVVLLSALVVVGVSAASGCSGEQRSAAGPSADTSLSVAADASSSAAASASVSASSGASVSASSGASAGLASGGVPDAPVPAQWRSWPTHEVQWTVWTPRDALVTGVEAEVVNGASPAGPVGCVPSPSPSPDTRSYWTCSLFARQGQRTVRARALKTSGVSEWSEAQVTFNRGSCTDAVAAAGACEEFDTGPGGGFVFYDAGSRQSWGQYLEAAPPGWSGSPDDPEVYWCPNGQVDAASTLAAGSGIGLGAANTQLYIETCGPNGPAGVAAAYRGGGKADWFLPSVDELEKVHDRRSEVGGLAAAAYQSSSRGPNGAPWAMCFDDSFSAGVCRVRDFVRPVRAF
jgi:hypothetical protein